MNRNVWITYYILNGNLLYFYRKQFNKSYNVLAWHSDFHRSIPTLWCWHQHYVNATNLFQFKYNKSMLLYVLSVKLRKLCINCKKEWLKSYFSVFPNCFIFQSRHTRYDHVINNKSWTQNYQRRKVKSKYWKAQYFYCKLFYFNKHHCYFSFVGKFLLK